MTRKTSKPKLQSVRFIEPARETECSEDEAEVRANMKRLVAADLFRATGTRHTR
jgi:hypothetical protein